jgi:hypothetical protein
MIFVTSRNDRYQVLGKSLKRVIVLDIAPDMEGNIKRLQVASTELKV